MHLTNCLNCEAPLQDDTKFCSECGQKTDLHQLSFHEIGHDVVHYFTHADKSIFQLLGQLTSKPGVVAREYVAGKRQKYFKPLNFFLIVAGIVVFMTSLFYSPNDTRSRQMELAAQNMQDPAQKERMLNMAARIKKVNIITEKYSNVINMIATPLLTFLFWLFYRKRYNYVESLVANMYFVGFIMLLYALLVVPLRHLFPQAGVFLIAIFFLFEIIYRGFAYYQFVNKKGRWQIAKAYAVSLLLTIVWVSLTYSLIVKYIRTGF